jgi:hypothetical protein
VDLSALVLAPELSGSALAALSVALKGEAAKDSRIVQNTSAALYQLATARKALIHVRSLLFDGWLFNFPPTVTVQALATHVAGLPLVNVLPDHGRLLVDPKMQVLQAAAACFSQASVLLMQPLSPT